jgi:hypothetical protein
MFTSFQRSQNLLGSVVGLRLNLIFISPDLSFCSTGLLDTALRFNISFRACCSYKQY